MPSIEALLHELDERTIANKIELEHDDARSQYVLRSSRIGSFTEFSDLLGDYYNYHYSRCVSRGGKIATGQAASRAKSIVENEYRRRNENINSAFADAQQGTHGGVGQLLNIIADALKREAVSMHVQDVFDRNIEPVSVEQKTEIVRQIFGRFGNMLPPTVDRNNPSYYATNYKELAQLFADNLNRVARELRRH